MNKTIDISNLLKRAVSGDPLASRELLLLQREGRALRLYPFGRKGPLDEGVTPIVIGRSAETGLILVEIAKPGRIRLLRKSIADIMRHHIRLSGLLWLDYCDEENPIAAIESQVVDGMDFRTFLWEDGISIEFIPGGGTTIEYGLHHSRELLRAWSSLIEISDLDYEEFGFDDPEEYFNILEYIIDDSEIY
jgi:hypothetical protein